MSNSINWVTIPHWHEAGFVGLSKANGLLRVRLNGETLFLGHAPKGGLGPRLKAYSSPKGTGQNHHAGRLIYEHRAKVEMQIAVIDQPAEQIVQLFEAELRKGLPPWNVPNGHWRRR
jgi:hypothetical protein